MCMQELFFALAALALPQTDDECYDIMRDIMSTPCHAMRHRLDLRSDAWPWFETGEADQLQLANKCQLQGIQNHLNSNLK